MSAPTQPATSTASISRRRRADPVRGFDGSCANGAAAARPAPCGSAATRAATKPRPPNSYCGIGCRGEAHATRRRAAIGHPGLIVGLVRGETKADQFVHEGATRYPSLLYPRDQVSQLLLVHRKLPTQDGESDAFSKTPALRWRTPRSLARALCADRNIGRVLWRLAPASLTRASIARFSAKPTGITTEWTRSMWRRVFGQTRTTDGRGPTER